MGIFSEAGRRSTGSGVLPSMHRLRGGGLLFEPRIFAMASLASMRGKTPETSPIFCPAGSPPHCERENCTDSMGVVMPSCAQIFGVDCGSTG